VQNPRPREPEHRAAGRPLDNVELHSTRCAVPRATRWATAGAAG